VVAAVFVADSLQLGFVFFAQALDLCEVRFFARRGGACG
jgi:hypothetical protein